MLHRLPRRGRMDRLARPARTTTACARRPRRAPPDAGDYSAWDRPQLQRLHVREHAPDRAEIVFLLEGLRCSACSWLIEQTLGRDGRRARDRRQRARASAYVLSAIPSPLRSARCWSALAHLGYAPHPLDASALDRRRRTRGPRRAEAPRRRRAWHDAGDDVRGRALRRRVRRHRPVDARFLPLDRLAGHDAGRVLLRATVLRRRCGAEGARIVSAWIRRSRSRSR